MSLESELKTLLDANTPLTALVGTNIFGGKLPEDATFPAVCYRRITTPENPRTFTGTIGLIRARIQFDSEAPLDSPDDADNTHYAVKSAIKNFRGGNIRDVEIADEREGYSADGMRWVRSLDAMIWFYEG